MAQIRKADARCDGDDKLLSEVRDNAFRCLAHLLRFDRQNQHVTGGERTIRTLGSGDAKQPIELATAVGGDFDNMELRGGKALRQQAPNNGARHVPTANKSNFHSTLTFFANRTGFAANDTLSSGNKY